MKNLFVLFIFTFFILLTSCIKDAPPNPEADVLTFSFSPEYLRTDVTEIYNTYTVSYPKPDTDLSDKPFDLTVTAGAEWERIDHRAGSDTLFYIKVTSEDKQHSKTYSITQVEAFPNSFVFDNWVKFSTDYLYENPKDKSIQWFSSNNGAAIAFADKKKPADNYPVKKLSPGRDGSGYMVQLTTMIGPGKIAGGIKYIPCLAGSLYLGGFNVFNGLTDPLSSTLFGVPFNNGKPLKLSGYYKYKEGTSDFINADGSTDPSKTDYCDIYAVLYKMDNNTQFLDGNTISTSPNRIAKAQIASKSSTPGNNLIYFEVDFDYDSYSTPFVTGELLNNQYKMAIVCTSSTRGAYYEGRPGSTLIVDDISVSYQVLNH